jgi:hypothetical protein
MAAPSVPCDIPHVGDVLIVFRRLATAAGRPQHAGTPGRETRAAMGDRRRGSDRPARRDDGSLGEDVRLLRLRPKVLTPR